MVILIIHSECVALSENKCDAPIPGDLRGPAAFLLGLKKVEPWAREIRISGFPGLIQSIEDFFQPLVRERLNHEHIVTLTVTEVKKDARSRLGLRQPQLRPLPYPRSILLTVFLKGVGQPAELATGGGSAVRGSPDSNISVAKFQPVLL
jgi:hypothetical protein